MSSNDDVSIFTGESCEQQAMMTSAYLLEKATSSNDDSAIEEEKKLVAVRLSQKISKLHSAPAEVPSKHDDVKLVYVVSHTVAAGVHLWSLRVHTSAACVGGCLQMCCNHQSLLVEPSEVEEGEM
ncbi:hypothetical protein F511_41293 [Dorcoceras hygrometricum]|uniref:Uncharacterized protein n=1 Tax=Dorcoceras hygrometricum TaxID=472368 RepID=A0A2Z7A9J4_9LAMI|nr:hypothetical protein F511_41293 [Dorcoceras hygrometricum]